MRTIWKYELEITDMQTIHVPYGHRILSVGNQNGTLCLWTGVEIPEDEGEGLVPVRIMIVGTGNPVSDEHAEAADFIGTVMMDSTGDPVIKNAFVWHVFELDGED